MQATKRQLTALPTTMLKWRLYGRGLERLHVETAPVPNPNQDELLVRQDACGLCFSDTKVIGLGPDHPRMLGRDMEADPVTLGHEVSCTIVSVGSNLADRFRIGERFIVQADVFHHGVSMAYGYAIAGGLAEYSIIPAPMIDGDEGCYLLPIAPDAGYVETALVEPWACVVAAYEQSHRLSALDGGRLLIIVGPHDERIDLQGVYASGAGPSWIGAIDASEELLSDLVGTLVNPPQVQATSSSEIGALVSAAGAFDDVIVIGGPTPELVEAASAALSNHGILNLVKPNLSRKLSIDIGRVHYNWRHHVGTGTARARDGYSNVRTGQLIRGGAVWFIGAGGPMGQMHVQLAIGSPNPPRTIVATDLHPDRLASLTDRFGEAAKNRGIDLHVLNVAGMPPAELDAELTRISSRGYDDIVSLVPVASLIEHAADYLATGGWLNIFAGVARGTMASIDLNEAADRGVRFLGSSGSSIQDMRGTLKRVESGSLSTNMSLAAIGGMRAAREGIAAVKDGLFPGKTLIFPTIPDLPLTPLTAIGEQYPTVAALLQDGKFWTLEAENELLRLTADSTAVAGAE